jgi:ribosome-associated protein
MLFINSRIQIPAKEFEFTFARSSGPGGQNVNKVNSKAILRWSVVASTNLPIEVQERFLKKYASRLTTSGEVILASQKYRDQTRNIDDCLEKLKAMIIAVVYPPKLRRPTKPSRASVRNRVDTKRKHSLKKQQRRLPQS